MPSIVIGKVKGNTGDAGVSPIVTLTKEENTLTISVTDAEGTKTESIQKMLVLLMRRFIST